MRALFPVTLFFSAALLFLVEPMIARMLLPSLGGTPAVWNTCLVFFQATLLGGYLYARLITRALAPRAQVALHASILAAAAIVLPVGIRTSGKLPSSSPVFWLLSTLALSVGLPFLALAATNPLVQSWFARASARTSDPYRLYSASNLGSFAGLLSYPVLIERTFALDAQSRLWTLGYAIVAVLVICCGGFAWRASRAEPPEGVGSVERLERLRWVALAFIPASLTLSVTAYISADIAAIPLVWILPLSLYLISLVIAFARPGVGRATRLFLPVAVLAPFICLLTESTRPGALQIPVHLVAFFLVSLACHQALASRRPDRRLLPEFYVWVAAGGAAAGLFNVLAAPILFRTPAEYPIGLLLGCYAGTRGDLARRVTWIDAAVPVVAGAMVPVCGVLAVYLGWAPSVLLTKGLTFGPPLLFAAFCWAWPLRFVAALGAILLAGDFATLAANQTLHVERSFFGVHRVMLDDTQSFHEMVDGNTIHGIQPVDRARRRDCLSYYSRSGPVGQTFAMLRGAREPRDIAVLGLGAGVLACYATARQRWTFFEIDPIVETIARTPEYFTYLADAPAAVRVVLGDARLSLDRETAESYNVIILDVFSSDAIPVHLLTREALDVYLRHLSAGGVILFHTSNVYLDLVPIVARVTREAGLVALVEHHAPGDAAMQLGIFPSEWVVVSRHLDDLGSLPEDGRWEPAFGSGASLWTDRFSNVLEALRWRF